MKQDDIERINRFVRLESPKSNRVTIIYLLIMIIAFFMFFVGNCVMLKVNLFTSHWMIFLPFAVILIAWGILLLYTLEKRQVTFFLYEFFAGVYLTTEFFALGFSKAMQFAQTSIWFPISLTATGALIFLLLILYRIRFFYGKVKKDTNSNKDRKKRNNALVILIILIAGSFVLFRLSFEKMTLDTQETLYTIGFFLLGYAMSMYMVFIGNYIVAKKYKDVIYLYEGEKLKKSKYNLHV